MIFAGVVGVAVWVILWPHELEEVVLIKRGKEAEVEQAVEGVLKPLEFVSVDEVITSLLSFDLVSVELDPPHHEVKGHEAGHERKS